MPKIRGRRMYKGYMSPAPGKLSKNKSILLSKVYGCCRTKNQGENKSKKQKCAKIAWSVVNK